MNQGVRNTLIALAGFIALVLGLFFYSFFAARTYSDEEYQQLGFYHFPEAREIAPFSLIDEQGKAVGIDDLKGQWSLLFFGFTTCPDVCPTTLGVVNRAMQKLNKPPQVILVSVDPERDRPALLARYVTAFNPDFRGYTGTFDDTVSLATQLNIAFGKVPGSEPGTYTVDHSASIVVVDPEARYVGFIKPPHNDQKIVAIMNSL